MYDHRWWLKCRLNNREVSFIYINSAAGAAAAAMYYYYVLYLLRRHRVRFQQSAWTRSIINMILYADARRTSMYSYKLACCCVPGNVLLILLLLLLLLLLASAVRHRVPHDKICSRGSLHLIPVFSFSSFNRDFFSTYPLAVLLSHFQRRFFYL